VFENGGLRRIFGPTREEVIRGWRKLHSEELYMYDFPDIIRVTELRMRWTRNVHGRDEKCMLSFSQKT
jgi:hypothetical protein